MVKPPFIQKLEEFGLKVLLPIETVIYKYVSMEIALKIIEGNSLLFSPPQNFNDPFDLTNALVDTRVSEQEFEKWLNSVANISIEKKIELQNKAASNPQVIHTTLQTTFEKFKSLVGITCFSKSYKKTLMWSHYAEKHSGVCLGFNIVPIGLEYFSLMEVNYVNEIKPLNYFLDKPFVLFHWLYTKSMVWSYEEEVRAVYQDRNGLISFDKNCLKEVYFGLKTTTEEREIFMAKLKSLNYKIKKVSFMTMNPKTFDLKENPLAE